MTKYLPAINDYNEVKYDFLANKNSKFLFNLFNKYQQDRGRQKHPVRHTKVNADNYALKTLQDRNWPYFINRVIEFSQGVFDLNDTITTYPDEVNILNDTRSNFEIVKSLYNELLTSAGINLHEYFMNLDIDKKQKIDTDLRNHNYFTWDPNETFVQNRILATYRDFYYETGGFLGRNFLVPVSMANMPLFVNSRDWISPRSLYETYVGRDIQGLTGVQFLAAFNKFLGGDKEISRNAMSEFFHNLSWQVLTNENDSIKIEFTAITELVNLIPTPDDIGLVPPERTGIQEVDDENYDEYLDTLQQIRPDLFISDDEISENDKSDDDVVKPVVEPKVEPKV